MLRLNKSTVQALIREAAAQPQQEVCGLVWANEGLRAQTVHPLPNIHPEPTKYYRTAPRDVRRAFDMMDEQGGKPLAWYHSHPGGKSDPSEEDMRGAFNTGMYYLIVYPEFTDITAGLGQVIGRAAQWQLSAWECVDTGVLVSAEYVVTP
jgi:proteasome lid subunit RPN8/RPN11